MTDQQPFVILMVDDNPNNLFTLRALLRPLHNCQLLEADSGFQALTQVLEHEVDLILLDIQMPGMDGFETAKHLQMTERTRHIPIIFITAIFKADEFIHRGYAIGAIDYLTKPIDDHQLLNRIRLYQRLVMRQRELADLVEELKAKEQALAQARDEALTANRAKGQFLAAVTHELNTPLNAVLGFTQVMQQDPAFPEHQRDNLQLIWRNGQRLLALINRILEITRLHNQEIEPATEAFSLDELLTWLKAGLDGRAETKGLQLACERDAKVPDWVLGDARLVRLVLFNLVENAIKYSKTGRIEVRFVAEVTGHIGFSVTDQGPGIEPEALADIFEPFHQSRSGLIRGEGTGLGLHLSREYVRLLGGDLVLDSAPGQGCRFSFSLLLPDAQIPSVPSPSPGLAIEPSETRSQPSHIGTLPVPLCQSLHSAAISLDLDVIRALLGGIWPDHPEAAAEIETLINEFRFDHLASLCKDCLTNGALPNGHGGWHHP